MWPCPDIYRLAPLLLCVVLAGCGPGAADIGEGCKSSADCHSTTCVTGSSDFPHGVCTASCKGDADCPEGTTCVDAGRTFGGLCATACSESEICKSGYICTRVSHMPSKPDGVFACNGSGLAE